MINSFIVKALPENNRLLILLDGYFMKSEIDLALDLVEHEGRKLTSGFGVLLDLRNMETINKTYPVCLKKLKDKLESLNCGEIIFKGTPSGRSYLNKSSVGLYPYEIGWNLL